MKTHLIVMLVFGLAYAKTTTEVESENVPQTTDSLIDPHTTEKGFDITSDPEIDPLKNVDASMEIVIEEDLKSPNLLNDAVSEFDLEDLSANEGDFYYNDVIQRDPNEIMDTAAGFAPLPFLKKKRRKTQRPYATRRFYQKPYAYRRFQYYYPYYYRFYRPSSLGYFNYYY